MAISQDLSKSRSQANGEVKLKASQVDVVSIGVGGVGGDGGGAVMLKTMNVANVPHRG